MKGLKVIILAIASLVNAMSWAQGILLEDFESTKGWDFIRAEAVELNMSTEPGKTGQAIRFDYDFTRGTGYGGMQKWFPIDLPENFEFSFYLKADSPSNNFEIKFIDSTGYNVWWVNNRNFDFPEEWTKIRIRPRHIEFAWGPTNDRNLRRIDRIEFTVASFVGGSGSFWVDDLRFETLPPDPDVFPVPIITASSSARKAQPENMIDRSYKTSWMSQDRRKQTLVVDFQMRREFGGLHIDWLKNHIAQNFEIYLSDDKILWEKALEVNGHLEQRSFIRLSEAQARYVKIELTKAANRKPFAITDMRFLDVSQSQTGNDFVRYMAAHSDKGYFPRYFYDQALYWTVVGANHDTEEALLSEDGMVEVRKAAFSLEPMLKIDNELFNWANVEPVQTLGFDEATEEFLFMPSVTWPLKKLNFTVSVAAPGKANTNSTLFVRYLFENTSDLPVDFEFYMLVRPYQVNPWYQFLNLPGGVGKINSISAQHNQIMVDGRLVVSDKQFDSFHAGKFYAGNPVALIKSQNVPRESSAQDLAGQAFGIAKYRLSLEPGEKQQFYVLAPFHNNKLVVNDMGKENLNSAFNEAVHYWDNKINHVDYKLPPSAKRIINTIKANLIYILINRDNAGIQPGSRSYERSWIRDGSLTSSALLKSGIVEEVRQFIEWFAPHQYDSGKVPCVVDARGPDPVPEHDSHGQLIYLIKEYYNFTNDTAFLREFNHHVISSVNYMEYLIAQRSTDYFRYGNDSVRAKFGMVPESISHEGYSAKPMHSYWDNFFVIKGLKDATEIQKILGNHHQYKRIAMIRDTFSANLYRSLRQSMMYKNIDFLPGCVELGDFDPTSTTIAITPVNELQNLPRPEIYNTFEKYFDFFERRRDGLLEWSNYTPYETRQIGTFTLLGQPERSHALIDFFMNDKRPQGWYHWAEIVWNEYRMPRFIGDMPHTWVGSDFINAIRAMLVHEDEYNQTIILGAGLYQDWIDAPNGMAVENLPTYYGDVSFSVRKKGNDYLFNIYGQVTPPENGFVIKNFNRSLMPVKVTVNGTETKDFTNNRIPVKSFPAEVLISY